MRYHFVVVVQTGSVRFSSVLQILVISTNILAQFLFNASLCYFDEIKYNYFRKSGKWTITPRQKRGDAHTKQKETISDEKCTWGLFED